MKVGQQRCSGFKRSRGRRVQPRVAVAAEVAVTLIVGHHQHDIRRLRSGKQVLSKRHCGENNDRDDRRQTGEIAAHSVKPCD